MYKIGDFSQLGQVSVRMLRHYDQLGLLKPGHVDRFTNYRYYTAEQLPRLNRILALRDLGFSLEETALLIENDLPLDRLRGLLRAKQAEIEDQLRAEAARLQRVAVRLRQIEQEGAPPRFDVATKALPAIILVSVRAVVPTLADMPTVRDTELRRLDAGLAAARLTPHAEMVVYHLDSYEETNIDMSMGVTLDGPLPTRLPAGLVRLDLPAAPLAATIVHRGDFYELADMVSSLYGWLGQHGYASAGPYRELHISGRELDTFANDASHDAVLEVQVPIEPLPAAA
jgi:DNA-binding transcriptional MerR regulator